MTDNEGVVMVLEVTDAAVGGHTSGQVELIKGRVGRVHVFLIERRHTRQCPVKAKS